MLVKWNRSNILLLGLILTAGVLVFSIPFAAGARYLGTAGPCLINPLANSGSFNEQPGLNSGQLFCKWEQCCQCSLLHRL